MNHLGGEVICFRKEAGLVAFRETEVEVDMWAESNTLFFPRKYYSVLNFTPTPKLILMNLIY